MAIVLSVFPCISSNLIAIS